MSMLPSFRACLWGGRSCAGFWPWTNPCPSLYLGSTNVNFSRVSEIHYCWIDDTYVFVLVSRQSVAMFKVKLTTINELKGAMYEVSSNMTTLPWEGMSIEIPCTCTENVRIYVWNCKGIARASFQTSLYIMMSIMGGKVVVLQTCDGGRNTRRLLKGTLVAVLLPRAIRIC